MALWATIMTFAVLSTGPEEGIFLPAGEILVDLTPPNPLGLNLGFQNQDPRTAWGMAQGATRLSQQEINADHRVALDRAAGKVLEVAF